MAPTLHDEKPQPGDLIEIFRGSYQHWAVYVGDGFVVHLVLPSEVSGAIAVNAIVKKEKLCNVVGTDQWKINNNLDKKYEPRPVHVIVKEACALVNETLPYSVISSNCEHFVNELRYGKAESRQVRKAGVAVMLAAVVTRMAIVAPLFGVVALASASRSRKGSKSTK